MCEAYLKFCNSCACRQHCGPVVRFTKLHKVDIGGQAGGSVVGISKIDDSNGVWEPHFVIESIAKGYTLNSVGQLCGLIIAGAEPDTQEAVW